MSRRDDPPDDDQKRPVGRVFVSDVIRDNPKAAQAFTALKAAGLTDQQARGDIARVMEHCMRGPTGKSPNLQARRARAEEGQRELDAMLQRLAQGDRARDVLPPPEGAT